MPTARVHLLIRQPPAEVFEAFVNPALTTQFWFTRASGRLEPGRTIRWDWEMYGVGTDVLVKAVEPPARLVIEWDAPNPTTVEWRFEPRGENATFVTITHSGFHGTEAEVLAQALDSTGGFSLVLAGCKAFLEHGLRLNLIADHNPDSLISGEV